MSGAQSISKNSPLRACMIQIGDNFGDNSGDQYYLPYAAGLLQAYAQSRLSNPYTVQFLPPLYRRLLPNEAVDYLSGCDLLFFSVYIWNHGLSSEIARLCRESNPDVVIIFGGPQVPENPTRLKQFLTEHPYVAIACFTEGEDPVVKILEHASDRDWSEVPGIAFRKDQDVVITALGTRIDDLDTIPSAYLSGVFTPLMAASPDTKWSALVETNRGCPFACAFCYWGAGDRKRLRTYGLQRVYSEIEWFAQHAIEFVFCCDANFGILPRDIEIVEQVAEQKSRCGYPRAFSVQSTKNSTSKIFSLQKLLNDAGLQKGVNLALQSLHQPTLDAIKRSNITVETYSELLALFNRSGIPTFSDLILGLPEETYDSYTKGVEQVVRQGQHNRIQFINLTVLENTAMADAAYIERYGLQLVESRIVAHHSSLDDLGGIEEHQRLVVGNYAMPGNDWIKARTFSWFMALFYFDRLLQIPMIFLDRVAGVGVCNVAEHFLTNCDHHPITAQLIACMRENAARIQQGLPEYMPSQDYLNIWWPLDEFLLIRLVRENRIDSFYQEARLLLAPFVPLLPEGMLLEGLDLNRSLIKKPFIASDAEVELSYPIPEMYAAFKHDLDVAMERGVYRYLIDRSTQQWDSWDNWMREMVWYGGKKGDYLYPCIKITADVGHEV